VHIHDLPTPALLVDESLFAGNLAAMAAALPGERLRPHVKAHKCTAIAHRQYEAGHHSFTTATMRESVGMARAGLGADLLLANEILDAARLRAAADAITDAGGELTVAVDSEQTVATAVAAGVRRVLIDVNVGLPRCGVTPDEAAELAATARRGGLEVRGVMGYEGMLMLLPDPVDRAEHTAMAMTTLSEAHRAVGGEMVSAGGTGTYAVNKTATEIQAGSYALMDTAYRAVDDLPFRCALTVLATVLSRTPARGEMPGYAVADAGLKAFGMDHGNPAFLDGDGQVWYLSDEHITFAASDQQAPAVGKRIRLVPAHIDPTMALHEAVHLVDGETVVATWPIDLRGW
jgi:D-serine deaminase-like pyridoxal phosphate-dependent protein